VFSRKISSGLIDDVTRRGSGGGAAKGSDANGHELERGVGAVSEGTGSVVSAGGP
jgi:hypothetical protein